MIRRPPRQARPDTLPFWKRVAALDVPIYLRPANPMTIPQRSKAIRACKAIFGWAAEMAVMRCGWCSRVSSTAFRR
jgi:hypothetical protein